MFVINKYSTWYDNIIKKAQGRNNLNYTYVEKHHIIPKSLGGSNLPQNIVTLTAKEHFVCHRLLVKMIEDPKLKAKMWLATFRMSHSNKKQYRYQISSRLYQKLREENAIAVSLLRQGQPGNPRSEETRRKISNSNMGRTFSKATREKLRLSAQGRKHSEETKAKFSKRVSNRLGIKLSEETKKRMSTTAKGRIFSEEHKNALRTAAKNRKRAQKTPITSTF